MVYNNYVSLFQYKRGFRNLVGVDYCDAAITMAKALAEKESAVIKFEASISYRHSMLLHRFDKHIDKPNDFNSVYPMIMCSRTTWSGKSLRY